MGTHQSQSQQSGAALDCLGYNLRSVDLAEAETETVDALPCSGSAWVGFIVMLLIAFALPLMKYERKLMSF